MFPKQNSDYSSSDSEDNETQKPKTLYAFKEINLSNKALLQEIRIICKNLIYVIGLAPEIAKEDILRKNEYFGQYGSIIKMIVIQSNTFNPPSHAAYITYRNEQEASLAILVKASFGTTKYCTNFLKGQQCKIKECVYLHQHPKDKDSTQVLKKEEMNNSKWLFSYSQKLAQNNFKRFYTKLNYKSALQKSVLPTIQNILDQMVHSRVVESLESLQQQQQQLQQQQKAKEEFTPPTQVLEKRLEAVILKMDTENKQNNKSRFKFTNGKNVPTDIEAINQLKQYVLK